jgi:hypothetical protein
MRALTPLILAAAMQENQKGSVRMSVRLTLSGGQIGNGRASEPDEGILTQGIDSAQSPIADKVESGDCEAI